MGQHRSKNDHDEETKSLLLKLLHVLVRKAGKKVSSVEGNEEYTDFFFVIEPIAARVLVHFFQVLLTWLNSLKLNTFYCSLQ